MRDVMKRVAIAVLKRIATVLAVLIILGAVARYTNLLDRMFIFFPDSNLVETPGDRGLDFEEVFFEASDGVKLHGWFVPGVNDITWIWFHGNAGNISHRVDNLVALHRRLGVNIFIFDYRGYGRSKGSISEQGAYRDAKSALDYVHSRTDLDDRRIVLFGRSMGCAVAVEMASRTKPYAVILESPFTSVQAMAKRVYPFFPGIGLLARTKLDSLAKIGDVKSPIMILHGDRDDIVPISMGKELFEAANPPKRFYTIEGAGHNDTYAVGGTAYYEALASFLDDLAATEDS